MLHETLFLAALNHLLDGHDWARHKLAQHAGRCAEVALPPLAARFVVQSDGRLAAADAAAIAEARVALPPLAVLRHLASADTGALDIGHEGDARFADDLANVLRGLRWDAEEDLAQIFGDIAAHRLAAFGKLFLAWPGRAALSLGGALVEYWSEENPLLVRRDDFAAFQRATDAARDAVERLEARVKALDGC